MKNLEINDAVECDFYFGVERPQPDEHHARTCPQCSRSTWAHTAACMWCGHDRGNTALRWVIGASCLAAVAGIFTLSLH